MNLIAGEQSGVAEKSPRINRFDFAARFQKCNGFGVGIMISVSRRQILAHAPIRPTLHANHEVGLTYRHVNRMPPTSTVPEMGIAQPEHRIPENATVLIEKIPQTVLKYLSLRVILLGYHAVSPLLIML